MASRVELPRSTPEAQGVSSEAILTFLDEVEREAPEFHSLMVLRNGNRAGRADRTLGRQSNIRPFQSGRHTLVQSELVAGRVSYWGHGKSGDKAHANFGR